MQNPDTMAGVSLCRVACNPHKRKAQRDGWALETKKPRRMPRLYELNCMLPFKHLKELLTLDLEQIASLVDLSADSHRSKILAKTNLHPLANKARAL